ncbi:hypothetical protein BX616_007606 [Lobosporangium transversale]|nr:hypothetical protein BX616_007606 [Lobosporangium transversale]
MDSHFVGRTSTACPRFCPDASPVIQPNSSSAQKDNDNQKSARWMKRILGKAAQLKQYSQNSVSKGTLFATKTGKSLKKHFLKGIHRDRQHDGDNEAYISDDDIYLRQNNLAAKSVAAFPLITTSMDSKDIRNESDSDPESDGDNSYDKEALDLRYFYDPQSEDSVNRITFLTGPEHYYHLALQLETSPCQEFQLYGKELYIRAAGLGYAPAQFKLGICYELGLTHFPMDPTQSFAWYKRAALQGHADAELAVSGWYLTGHPQGLIQSEPLAYEWASKAAKRGWAKAEYTLGHYYEVGIGVPQDLAVAKQWYIKAAAQGNERALLRLLVGHVGLDVDYAHLKDALLHQNQNNPYLIHQLAQFHEHREYGLVPDEDAAFELYAASAQANYAPAQYKLGACYEFGILGCPQDPVQAVHWYRRGAENGHVEALLALAGFYLDGSAGQAAEQSDEEAFRFVEAAAQRGVPKAEYITGFFLEHGLGVEQNINEAKRWYHLACAKGVDSAEKRLKDLEKLSDFS